MSVQIKSAGAWKLVTQPWFRVGTTWTKAIKVWVNVNGTWKEAYPLQPGPVTGVVSSTLYRNDRIEIDIDWVAPTSGEATSKYLVTVNIGAAAAGPFDYTTTVTVNAPTTAVTLTNSAKGFQTYAGKKLYVSIIAQSAAGRNSDPVSPAVTTVAQLPAPPAPTTYTMTIDDCKATHGWTIVTDNRVTGVELATQFNDAPASPVIKRYADNVFGASYQSWNPDTIGAGKAEGMLRTYGPGGVSAWKTVSGTMPGPVATSNFRFTNGRMVVNTSGINPRVEVWTAFWGASGWTHNFDVVAGATSITVTGSENWARDANLWGMTLKPVNIVNGWHGRDQLVGWIRKMPNPYYISPDAGFSGGSHTYRNGVGRPEEDQEWQGSTASGQNTCYAFYGTRFNTLLSTGYVGFTLNCTAAQIALTRVNAGGLGAAVHPRLMLHRAEHGYGDLYHAGGYDSTALARGGSSWCALPTDWAENLMQFAYGYRGVGLFHPNTALYGGASAEYMILVASAYGSLDGHRLFTVRIYHDG